MRLLVINNLSSGLSDGSIYDFMRALLEDGDEVVVRATDGTTEVSELLVDAASFDAVIASGGDGTIATVCGTLAYTGVPVLPFPAGTANLLATNLMSPMEPHALAKLVRNGRDLDFDIGVLQAQGRRVCFDIMAGAGYDAVIMRGAEPNKKAWGPMAYFSAAFSNPLPQRSKLRLFLDDEEPLEAEGLGVLLVNFSKIQFDITVTHDNEPRDGMLDVVVIKAENAFELIPTLFAGFLDRDGEYPQRGAALEMHRARRVRVEADPPLEIQYDGEPTDLLTPFEAEILPGAARLIVSDEGYELFS